MKHYRGQILKTEGNVTYVCFNPSINMSIEDEHEFTDGSLALVEE